MNSKDTTLRRSGIGCSRWAFHQNLADSSFSGAYFLNKLLSFTERSTLSIEHVAFDLGFGDNHRTVISHTCGHVNVGSEPRRICRRLILSNYAAMAGVSSMT